MGMDIGNLSGPIIFGAIIERFNSYHVAFLIAPILLLITTLVLLPYSIKNEIKVCVFKHQK
jgi:MFS family permease